MTSQVIRTLAAILLVLLCAGCNRVLFHDIDAEQRKYVKTHDCTAVFHSAGYYTWDYATSKPKRQNAYTKYTCKNPDIVLLPDDE